MIDPATSHIVLLTVPSIKNSAPALYGLAVGRDGTIWFAGNSAATLGRYRPDHVASTFYSLPVSSSPYGFIVDTTGRVWFTQYRV